MNKYHEKKVLITVFFLLTISSLYGQNFEKVIFNKYDENDYYIQLKPPTVDIKGVVVLLPGYGEMAESIFPSSNLFNVAYSNDIMVIAIAGGEKIYADEDVIDKLNSGLTDLVNRNPNIPKEKFVIGGFSAGGTISLRYVEHIIENPSIIPITFKGVFTVDSPVDLIDIWEYFQREIKKNYSNAGVFEAEMISEKMRSEIGTPKSDPEQYNDLTPFNHRMIEEGNEKYLKDIAVRVYHDIDIEWQLKQRRRSLFDSNQLSASELINRLLLMGNKKAEFMTAKLPGVRSNGMRHPHSWSIVNEVECIQWVLNLFE